ncbi:uncharacterized protein [Ptychodera flava]|uniref:uncharacterized protein n=1 Tax=Ptychodera flava TaxID=63121 RepID=UPI00396A1EF6
MTEADVVCLQLGYPGAMWDHFFLTIDNWTGMWLTDLTCHGNESSILQCEFALSENCQETVVRRGESAAVTCNYDGYVGCYQDNKEDRALPDASKRNRNVMTVEYCLDFCRSGFYAYSGVEDGERCFCGIEDSEYWKHGKLENADCNKPCVGDGNQACGGNQWILGIYETSMGACGGVIHMIHEEKINIHSPDFPGIYPRSDATCEWIIYGTNESNAIFSSSFLLFDLRIDDFLEIRDGHSDEANTLGSYGSSSQDLTIPSTTTNSMRIKFKSFSKGDRDIGMFIIELTGIKRCIYNDTLTFGHVEPNRQYFFMPGDELYIGCEDGYSLTENYSTVTCQDNGTWDSTIPSCLAVQCSQPDDVENAEQEGNIFTFNNSVIFKCNDGYDVVGDDVIICQANGTWTKLPVCLPIASDSSQTALIVSSCVSVLLVIIIAIVVVMYLKRDRLRSCFRSSAKTHDDEYHGNSQVPQVQLNNTKNNRQHVQRTSNERTSTYQTIDPSFMESVYQTITSQDSSTAIYADIGEGAIFDGNVNAGFVINDIYVSEDNGSASGVRYYQSTDDGFGQRYQFGEPCTANARWEGHSNATKEEAACSEDGQKDQNTDNDLYFQIWEGNLNEGTEKVTQLANVGENLKSNEAGIANTRIAGDIHASIYDDADDARATYESIDTIVNPEDGAPMRVHPFPISSNRAATSSDFEDEAVYHTSFGELGDDEAGFVENVIYDQK